MSRRVFGRTWWGRAWVQALEGRAKLDPNRLPRGRTYARKGQVGSFEVSPGEIRAEVRGSRPSPYRVTVRTHRFTTAQWDTLLVTIGRQAGYAAALLDGELPSDLAEHARAAGADLLPGPGDLKPRCSCPDFADPCKHSAAVCYLVADEVDADPFVLFLLRGKDRAELLAELRARRSRPSVTRPNLPEPAGPGIAPAEAFARERSPVPSLPPPPDAPGRPAEVALSPPPASGVRVDALQALAADAAARAWRLLTGGEPEDDLSVDEDLARRAADALHGGPVSVAALAAEAGMSTRELTRWAIAWREAGRGGLAALRETWQPPPGRFYEVLAELDESGLPGETKIWRNRVTRGALQLRLARDGRWYRFSRSFQDWLPDGPGSPHPLDLL
ncbi:SWIM zinc finger family protein [Amycolatopsis thermophila]|uniref:Zn finger protein n=1 Tax=Amycolatopsis thermophila TaxID=206084 RepID=A0ABU0EXZ1_9PSEU|nr:SWIM zinc finger family protein [Amycolatopsis thermophila]MDQ0380141.1 putative Zn finger protein [Amycolatopsis thermophila]